MDYDLIKDLIDINSTQDNVIAKSGVVLKFIRRGPYLGVRIRKDAIDITHTVHRLLIALHLRRAPLHEVDHIDGNKDNNKLSNLREATKSQNMCNVGVRQDNLSGYKGVYGVRLKSGRMSYRWIIYSGDEILTKQGYRTPLGAHEGRSRRLALLHGEFANNGSSKID